MATQETILRYKLDESAAQRLIRQTEDLQRAEAAVRQELAALEEEARAAGIALDKTATGRARTDMERLEGSVEGVANAFDDVRLSADSADDAIRRAASAQERFDQISREVALAGDVQSNLGALSGLAGAAGAGGLGGNIAVAGEFAALTEELPRLKQAVAGIPDVLSSAADAIGIPGGAFGFLGAVAGIGAAFLVVKGIFDDINESARTARENAQRQIQAALNASARVAAVEAEGTLSSAESAIEATRRRIVELDAQVADALKFENLIEALEDNNTLRISVAEGNLDTDEIDRFLAGLNTSREELAAFGVTLEDIARDPETLRSALNELQGQYESEEIALRRLIDLRDGGTLSTEDAAAAEQQLATTRQQLLTAAQQLIQTEVQQAQLLDQSTEALNDRLDAIEAERRGIEEAVEFLRASGDTSEEVARQIEAYEQTLQRLGETQDFINNQALQAARAREEQAEAEEGLEQAREEEAERLQRLANAQAQYNNEIETITERGLQSRLDLETRYADRLVDIAQQAVEDSEKALADLEQTRREASTDLSRDIQDAEIERGRELLDNQIDLQRREVDLAKDTARRIEDIRRASAAREEDLLLQSDFAGLFQNRRQTNRDVESALTDQSRAREDLETTIQRAQQDQARAFEEQRQDRLREYQRQLTDAQDQYDREIALIRENESKALALAETEYQKQTNALQDSLNEQLNARQSTYAKEIQMASQTAAQLQAIEAQKNAALIAQAQASLNAINRLGSQVFANINNTTNNTRIGVGGNLVVQSTGAVRDVQQAVVGVLNRLLP